MTKRWMQYLLGWFRTRLNVSVVHTGDVLEVDHDLGLHPGQRWRGRLRLRSQRQRLVVRFNHWWLPPRHYDQYDVSGVIYSTLGNEVVLPPLTFPRMAWRWASTGRYAHSLAIEAFVDRLVGVVE